MEWSRVKSILICVFALVNVFLLYTYMLNSSPANSLSETTIVNTVQILNKNNVKISKDIIPVNTDSIKVFDAENKYLSPKALATDLLGEMKNVKTDGENFEFVLPDKAKDKLNEKSAESFAKLQVKKLKLLPDSQYEIITSNKNGSYNICFLPTYDGKRIIDSNLNFNISSDGTVNVKGYNWLIDSVTDNGIIKGAPIIDILINFATNPSRNKAASVEINDIKICYSIGSRKGQKIANITGLPVWELKTKNGNTYYYDVRDGKQIK